MTILPAGQIGLIRGSAELAEMAIPDGSLAERYSVRIDDRVRI